PPPLVTDYVHVKVGGGRSFLRPKDDLDGRDTDDDEDQREGDRPSDFEDGVPVDLLRDRRVAPVPEPPAAVEESSLDRDEDDQRDPGDLHEDLVDRPAEVRARTDGRHGTVPETPSTGGGKHAHHQQEQRGTDSGGAHEASDHGGRPGLPYRWRAARCAAPGSPFVTAAATSGCARPSTATQLRAASRRTMTTGMHVQKRSVPRR